MKNYADINRVFLPVIVFGLNKGSNMNKMIPTKSNGIELF